MHNLFTICFAASLAFALTLLVHLCFPQSSNAIMHRLYEATNAGLPRHAKAISVDRYSQLVSRVALWSRTHLGLQAGAGLGKRIERAGYRGPMAIDLYTALRVTGPLAAMVVALLIPHSRVFWILALPAAAYIVPDLVLEGLIRKRHKVIRRSIPDAIDLLVICVDAGLGIDQAMMRVAQELTLSSPQLQDELMQVNREQRAGKPRLEAWRALSGRLAIPEMEAFVNMLTQTERFGTPIARALSNFASGIRLKRTQSAEESAAKATVKIIFPLVLFIFPCLFIVLLGPAGITMLRSFPNGF